MSTYGMIIRDASGNVVFDTYYRLMRIIAHAPVTYVGQYFGYYQVGYDLAFNSSDYMVLTIARDPSVAPFCMTSASWSYTTSPGGISRRTLRVTSTTASDVLINGVSIFKQDDSEFFLIGR
jgi:hypothetical protein